MIKSCFSFLRNRHCNTTVVSHAHKSFEFVYFLTGNGQIEYQDIRFEFSAGSYYLMPPDVFHAEFFSSDSQSLVIQFDNTLIPWNRALVQNDSTLNLYHHVELILSELHNKHFAYDFIIDCHMTELFVSLCRQHETRLNTTSQTLEHSVAYIDEYFMTSISISELAATCNYSEGHYRLLFKKLTGLSPKEYILEKRISYAKKQLRETKYTIEQICFNCGFEYYSHFMSVFRLKTGSTPSNYRNSLNK